MLVELDEVMTFLKSELTSMIEDDAFGFAEVLLSILKDMERHEWTKHDVHPATIPALPLFSAAPASEKATTIAQPVIKHVDRTSNALDQMGVTTKQIYEKLEAEIFRRDPGTTITNKDLEDYIQSIYPSLSGYLVGKCRHRGNEAVVRNFIKFVEDNPIKGIELVKHNHRLAIQRTV